MSNRTELLSFYNGTAEYFHYDAAEDRVIIEDVQDCEPVIEAAKRLSEQTPGEDFRHVAFIPDFVMRKAMREGWANDNEAWRKWANDPDNKAFRTWPGRI